MTAKTNEDLLQELSDMQKKRLIRLERQNAELLEALGQAYDALLPSWADNFDICANIDTAIRKAKRVA